MRTNLQRVVAGAGKGMLLQLKRIIDVVAEIDDVPVVQGAGGLWERVG